MAWVLLVIAGLFETIWAVALKESAGFSRLVPTIVFLVAGLVSIVLLALALKTIPVGTGYAVWTGIGAVGAALAGVALLGESAALDRLGAIGLVTAGIVWLALEEAV